VFYSLVYVVADVLTSWAARDIKSSFYHELRGHAAFWAKKIITTFPSSHITCCIRISDARIIDNGSVRRGLWLTGSDSNHVRCARIKRDDGDEWWVCLRGNRCRWWLLCRWAWQAQETAGSAQESSAGRSGARCVATVCLSARQTSSITFSLCKLVPSGCRSWYSATTRCSFWSNFVSAKIRTSSQRGCFVCGFSFLALRPYTREGIK